MGEKVQLLKALLWGSSQEMAAMVLMLINLIVLYYAYTVGAICKVSTKDPCLQWEIAAENNHLRYIQLSGRGGNDQYFL